ncbi:hypothetical protein IWX50DRAFT_72089 [Phyllosticta citricarpa]
MFATAGLVSHMVGHTLASPFIQCHMDQQSLQSSNARHPSTAAARLRSVPQQQGEYTSKSAAAPCSITRETPTHPNKADDRRRSTDGKFCQAVVVHLDVVRSSLWLLLRVRACKYAVRHIYSPPIAMVARTPPSSFSVSGIHPHVGPSRAVSVVLRREKDPQPLASSSSSARSACHKTELTLHCLPYDK